MDFIRNFMKASLHTRVRRSVTFMTMINKEKVLKGVGKAVDAANNAADKAAAFAKEKELDKKAKNMAHTLEDGIKSAGESLENLFKN